MQTTQIGTIRFLRLLMVGSVALPVILFAYASWLNYNATYRAADERIDRSLTIVQENAAGLFQSAELLIAAANTMAGTRSDDDIRAHEQDIHDLLQGLAKPLDDIHSVWIFAADGRPLVSSNIYPVPRTFSNADRDYFAAQVERDAGTYIGAVVAPKVSGPAIFTVSRRRSGERFNGVIAVAIQPADSESFYRAIGTLPGSYYALLRADGTFLARYPAPTSLGLRLDKNSTTMKSIAANPDSGINSLTSQTDAVKRRLGYRKLPGYPVYLLAAVDRDAIIDDWLRLMASHLIFGVPATAIMFAAIFYGMVRTQRLIREQDAREKAELALRQSQKMEAIGQLTGGVAHDFNNLLTIVIGNLDMAKRALERGADGMIGRVSQAVDNALQGARRGANLTQRLLAFSRQQPLEPAVLDVNVAVKESLTLLRRALGENYELEVVLGAGAWNIEVDSAQLDVTLVNLVVNARDAIEEGGKVTIETGNAFLDDNYCRAHPELKSGQYAMIAVSDSGSGMAPEVLARAFEPFFTTKSTGRGTGLGLSQVYGFVKQSGGHVTLYSEPGQGTAVKMYFPRAYRDTDQIAKPTQAAALVGGGQRILVVEDDGELRKYVTDTLRDLNYDVTEAANGEEALKAVEAEGKSFDALLTDVVMPGLNGRQLADRITALSPATRVIYMTGYSRNAIIHHGRLDPGLKLLQKPFSRADLAAHIGGLWA
jgi:signal transduction histidine kinase